MNTEVHILYVWPESVEDISCSTSICYIVIIDRRPAQEKDTEKVEIVS
jgi:hypothetical protein